MYQGLSARKPDLDAGPYSYARAGFGDLIGFNSTWASMDPKVQAAVDFISNGGIIGGIGKLEDALEIPKRRAGTVIKASN
jgi:hypothetical protein